MNLSKMQIRTIMFYEWKRGSNVKECLNNMKSCLGNDVVHKTTIYKFYARFSNGNFNLEDDKRSGRPNVLDDTSLLKMMEENQSSSTKELSNLFKTANQTIRNHLHDLGYSSVLDRWIPHELSKLNRQQRVNVCNELIVKHRKDDFIPRIITCDEKWVYYANPTRRRSWRKHGEQARTIAKHGLTNAKVLLCIFWDSRGVLYKEYLKSGQTVTKEVYIKQLEKVNDVIKRTWPSHLIRKGIILQQDNAKAHTANLTKQKIAELGWTALKHAPYSPDKAPSDFYLFRCLQNHLASVTFKSSDEAIFEVDSFLSAQTPDFFKRGMYKLPERWEQIVKKMVHIF